MTMIIIPGEPSSQYRYVDRERESIGMFLYPIKLVDMFWSRSFKQFDASGSTQQNE